MFLGLVSVACFFKWFPLHFFMVSVAGLLVDSAAAGGSIILERIERFLFFFFVFLGLVSVAVFSWFPSWQENIFFLWFPSLFLFCYGFRRCFFFLFYKELFSVVARNVFVWFPSFYLYFILWVPAATGPRLSLRWKP